MRTQQQVRRKDDDAPMCTQQVEPCADGPDRSFVSDLSLQTAQKVTATTTTCMIMTTISMNLPNTSAAKL